MRFLIRFVLALLVLGFAVYLVSVAVPAEKADKKDAAGSATAGSPRSTTLQVGPFPGTILALDVNRDGKPDLVVARVLAASVAVLLGDGKGGFTPSPGSPFPAGPNPTDLDAGDLDGNGTLDLAIANHDAPTLTVLLGDGKGDFKPAPGSPLRVQSRPHPHGIVVADFDGDRKLDLATESWQIDKVEVLFGDGKGGFATPGPLFPVGRMPYQRLRSADFDRDGRSDLATTNFEGASVSVLLADGKRGFRSAPGAPFPVGDSPFSLAVGDLNGDGKPDLATAHYSGHSGDTSRDGVNVLLGDGKGGFKRVAGSPFPTGRSPVRMTVGDLDGDGKAEIATVNFSSGDVSVLKRTAQGGYAIARTLPAGKEPEGVVIADWNGDGKADLAVTGSVDNRVTIFWGPVLGR